MDTNLCPPNHLPSRTIAATRSKVKGTARDNGWSNGWCYCYKARGIYRQKVSWVSMLQRLKITTRPVPSKVICSSIWHSKTWEGFFRVLLKDQGEVFLEERGGGRALAVPVELATTDKWTWVRSVIEEGLWSTVGTVYVAMNHRVKYEILNAYWFLYMYLVGCGVIWTTLC